jgi:ComEC/Rec2-related protein
VVGRVVRIAEYENFALLELDNVNIDGNNVEGRLNAYLPATFYKNVRVADEVVLRGYISTDTNLIGDLGFRARDIRRKLVYTMGNADSCAVAGRSSNPFLLLRARIQTVVDSGMDEDAASVTMAMLTGDSSGIEDGLLENIRAGGIAHVFAVSGLHIGSLYAFCLLCIQKTSARKLPKWARFLLTAIILFFYVGVCGFTASSVRAMVMCLSAYAMKLIGVKEDFLQSLGLSAVILLVATPTALFEAGFQLSFAACWGLALFVSPIQRGLLGIGGHIFKKEADAPIGISERIWRKASSLISVSLAAQAATAPILLHWFGFVSGWALLLNVLFVPIIGGIFSILLFLVVLSCLLPAAASKVLLYVPSTLWQTLLLVFEIFDFSSFAWTKSLSVGAIVCYYGGWLFATDKWNISKRLKRALIILCFLGFGVTMFALSA